MFAKKKANAVDLPPFGGRRRAWDQLALALFILAGTVALLTFRDYGLSWDDYTHSQYGDLLLSFYRSGLRDRRALSWVNLYYYGGGFDLVAAAAAKLLPLGLFETRRLVGAAVGIIGLLVSWRLARRIAGPLAGFAALALLCACPLYWGHMFMNPKDAPFAVAMVMLLYALARALEEYPGLSLTAAMFVGTGFGLAFGSRIMGAFGPWNSSAHWCSFLLRKRVQKVLERPDRGCCASFLRFCQPCCRPFWSWPCSGHGR